MANSFKAINDCLNKYYESLGDLSYLRDDDRGKFLAYCEDQELEEDMLNEELFEYDPEDCSYCEFDDDFPFQQKNLNETERINEMLRILRYIFEKGTEPVVNKDITSYFMKEINEKDKDATEEIYKKQVYKMLGDAGFNDETLSDYLTLGHLNGDYSFLSNMVDSYNRDRITSMVQSRKLNDTFTVDIWVKQNQCLMDLNETKSNKIQILQGAVNSYLGRITPQIVFKPVTKIADSLLDICTHIKNASNLIAYILNDNNGSKNTHSACPFQMDFMILVNKVEVKEAIKPSAYDDEFDSDDDDAQPEPSDFDSTSDCVGDVHAKLSHEKIEFAVNNAYNKAKAERDMIDAYKEFNNKIKKKENKNAADYPRKRRFIALMDRRKMTGKGGSDEKKEQKYDGDGEVFTVFDAPRNCNTMPKEQHVAEWYFGAARECLVPRKGYDNGNYDENEDVRSPQEILSEQDATINALTACNNLLMTFSFHIEQMDEIKCYLFWAGTCIRFYPQDIVHILPLMFVEGFGDNAKFPDSDEAIKIAEETKIYDHRFELMYKSLNYGNKLFPNIQKRKI